VAGAEGSPNWSVLQNRKVFLYADGDDTGRKAVARWEEEAREHGILAYALDPLERDFCDVAGKEGREVLRAILEEGTAVLYTEHVAFEDELEALRLRLAGIRKERAVPVGSVGGRTVYRLQAYFEGPPIGILAW